MCILLEKNARIISNISNFYQFTYFCMNRIGSIVVAKVNFKQNVISCHRFFKMFFWSFFWDSFHPYYKQRFKKMFNIFLTSVGPLFSLQSPMMAGCFDKSIIQLTFSKLNIQIFNALCYFTSNVNSFLKCQMCSKNWFSDNINSEKWFLINWEEQAIGTEFHAF